MEFLIITFLISISLILFYLYIKKEKNKYSNIVYLKNLQQIKDFIEQMNRFNDYVTWIEREQIKSNYSYVGKYFKNKTKYYKKEKTVKKFNDIFSNFDNFIASYNQNYVNTQKEKLKQYFDDIEGKKLDDQQRTALITDEYSNLIIAGAGSGKTLTILGKVKYLVEKKNISPKEILLLSFTKKTVKELNERLKKLELDVQATTFHKLSYDVIKKYQSFIPSVTNENTLSSVIKEYLKTDILNNSKALQSYIQYVACYMNIPEDSDNYGSLGDKIDNEKGVDLQTLKSKCESLNKISKSSLDTIQGERVKSVEELIIANFLYLNGINYEYEKPYPFGEVMYRPDFYLKDYDIYLEHFGVDENNRAKWLTPFNEEEYIKGMEIKREAHRKYNTQLLETYSYYNRDNILIQKLTEMLENCNVSFKPIDTKLIYTKVSNNDENFGDEIIKLIESFINLSKSRKLDKKSLQKLFSDSSKTKNSFMLERQELFLQFVLPILEKYDNTLKERNEIDFNDMINHATDLIKENTSTNSYKYIIIDEYQDISYSRFNLIREIRDLSGARLICVGDDWQSIYRFAGSDISLFSNFEKYVGKFELLLIEHTYRNSQSLIDITSDFIKKNPRQFPKNPKSKKEPLEEPIKFVHYPEDNLVSIFINTIKLLKEKYGNKSILVLGRHSFDVNGLINLTTDDRIKYYESSGKLKVKGFEEVDIKFLTVHKSKGTESDNVILLNLENHLLGFPNKMSDDPILHVLLSEQEEYKLAEERRLFYVALTRTKNENILLIPSDVSLFVKEILLDNNYLVNSNGDSLKTTNCPYCITGKLVIRDNTSNGKKFLGCSNYPVCNQTFNDLTILENQFLCPDCNSGFMTKRTGKYGSFLGCTNYPKCKSTINLQ